VVDQVACCDVVDAVVSRVVGHGDHGSGARQGR
jgi:hypothetical protein